MKSAPKKMPPLRLHRTSPRWRAKANFFTLFVALLFFAAPAFGQKVTLNEKNISVEKALLSIASQSGLKFLYHRKDIPPNEKSPST